MPIVAFVLVLVAGVGLAMQAPTNAALARHSGSVLLAALTSFVVGGLILLIAWLALDRTSPAGLRHVPAWTLTGGLYGAVFVAAMAFAAPRLGLATTLTIAIASQLIVALALDHFGWLELPAVPISWPKVGGVVLILVGVFLVRRG